MDFDLRDRTILLTLAGSRAYGVHRPDSDVDVRGVAIAPASHVLGTFKTFEQADSVADIAAFVTDLAPAEQEIAGRTKLDGSVYALRKLVRLASDCNPNILDVLFCRDAEVRRITPLGRRLRDARDLFLSSRARHSYAGYATSQLKRIRGHRRWLLDPPDHEPTRAEFDLPEVGLMPTAQLDVAEAAVRRQVDSWEIDYGDLPGSQVVALQERMAAVLAEVGIGADERWAAAARKVGFDDNLIWIMQRERAYKAAHREWRQYHQWVRSRNPDRAALEKAHGYDTKHAAHLVRLLRMGREILTTGQVHVWRGDRDADELRGIRDGAWSYDDLLAHAEAEMAELDAVPVGARAVPDRVDRDAIDALVVGMLREVLATDGSRSR